MYIMQVYILFNSGEPSGGGEEHCLETTYNGDVYWNDVTCNTLYQYVCEKGMLNFGTPKI